MQINKSIKKESVKQCWNDWNQDEMISVALWICCVSMSTGLVTGLCVNVHKTGRFSEYIEPIDYFRKEHGKDEKQELGKIHKLWIMCFYCVSIIQCWVTLKK